MKYFVLTLLIFLQCFTSFSQRKDSIKTWQTEVGINISKSEVLFYKTCDCSTFLQDIPDGVGKESAFDDNRYIKYDEQIWFKKDDSDLLKVYPLKKSPSLNLNLQLKLSYKKVQMIVYANYFNQYLFMRSTVKNENVRDYVYQLNPNFKIDYKPQYVRIFKDDPDRLTFSSPATLSVENTNKLDFQFFLKKRRNKKIQFSLLPGIGIQLLLKQKVFYRINENYIKKENHNSGYSYYFDEKNYFKLYNISPLLNAAFSCQLTPKLKINANTIYQIQPIWQSSKALETIKTSRIGVGVGLSYIIEKKKCKACPIQ